MITKKQLDKLKIGDYIEDPGTNTLFEVISTTANEQRFKTIYSQTDYIIGANWGNGCHSLEDYIVCSKERLQYYKKLMVFQC